MRRALLAHRRWLLTGLALLAMFSSVGWHDLDLAAETASLPVPSGEVEFHAGDCPHSDGLALHHDDHCLLCKLGRDHQVLLPAANAAWDLQASENTPLDRTGRLRPVSATPGILGARGPPPLVG